METETLNTFRPSHHQPSTVAPAAPALVPAAVPAVAPAAVPVVASALGADALLVRRNLLQS